MRINQLSCCADSCQNYKNGYCILSSIEVSGIEAKSSAATCCENFVARFENFSNDTILESPYADVRCNAEECVYNEERCCLADYVDIAGHAASSAKDTLCSTFRTEKF